MEESQETETKSRVDDSSGAADLSDNIEKTEASGIANAPGTLVSNSQDRVDLSPAGEVSENPTEGSQNQLVLYDSTFNGTGEGGTLEDPSSRVRPFANRGRRVAPSIGAYSVQCARCFKWRLMPTKAKYEEIREHIMERPFFCESGREWRHDISCEIPPDIVQDRSRIWAIDKPGIAQTPSGWQRHLRLRNRGGTKFAECFYVSPLGKRLRSMVEVRRHLDDHPELNEGGRTLPKISFEVPKPLEKDYVRKRARPTPTLEAVDPGIPVPSSVPIAVQPLSWVMPSGDRQFV